MYHLSIATPEKVIFDDKVISLIAPGADGYFEILTHHAPIIALLKMGKVIMTDQNGKRLIYTISGGFLEFSHNQGTLLVDTAEAVSETDQQAQLADQWDTL